jgi:hypothetical protein
MRANIKMATAVCAVVLGLGMVGCGSSNTPATPPAAGGGTPTVTPDYAKKVDMNLDLAKGALNIVYGDNTDLYAMAGMSATAQEAKRKRGEGMSEIPYMLLSFLQKFTHQYSGGGGYPGKKTATRPEDHNVTLTFSCAYSGSYTVHEQVVVIDMGSEESYKFLKEYTFDACDHDSPIEMDFDDAALPPQYHFNYSGNLRFDVEYSDAGCCPGVDKEKVSLEANSFVFSATEDGKKVQDLSANFAASFDMYETSNVYKYDIAMDGDVDAAEYNATSGEKVESFALKTKEYQYRGREERKRYFDLNMDGYAFVAPDMNVSHAAYIYGDGFKVVYQGDASDQDLWDVRFNGVLGTSCLGGSVAFETTAAWDVNTTMHDYDDGTGYPKTPFAGKTTIAGADSKAEITFGKTADPKSWAQIGMVGEAPEAKTTIIKIMDENCTVGIF